MDGKHKNLSIIFGILKYILIVLITVIIACTVSLRMLDIAGVRYTEIAWDEFTSRISRVEKDLELISERDMTIDVTIPNQSPLYGKKIIYDGDSIAANRENNGGGYAALIAEQSESTFENYAEGGAWLSSSDERHSVVDNIVNLPDDGDLYCFEGGINDYWANIPLGECDPDNYEIIPDTNTICGAMEAVFRYCLENFPGTPVCFVIVHKIQNTAISENNNGDTFEDYRNAMILVCQKYSIPYYDAFGESGLNGWNETQNKLYLTGNKTGNGDGIHPNLEGYKRYYVPQLLTLFEKIMPMES